MNLRDTVTVINIINEEEGTVRCTKVSKCLVEKNNQVAVSGSTLVNQDVVTVYFGLKKSDATRERVSAADFTADPTDNGIFAFRKGDFIVEGDRNFNDIEEVNQAKQQLGTVYEIISVQEYLFGSLANITITCR